MITKEYGKHFGVCDVCDAETPRFTEWDSVRFYMRKNDWSMTKNKRTGEWEHTCPECQALNG